MVIPFLASAGLAKTGRKNSNGSKDFGTVRPQHRHERIGQIRAVTDLLPA
jgi:hypothetical protein